MNRTIHTMFCATALIICTASGCQEDKQYRTQEEVPPPTYTGERTTYIGQAVLDTDTNTHSATDDAFLSEPCAPAEDPYPKQYQHSSSHTTTRQSQYGNSTTRPVIVEVKPVEPDFVYVGDATAYRAKGFYHSSISFRVERNGNDYVAVYGSDRYHISFGLFCIDDDCGSSRDGEYNSSVTIGGVTYYFDF